MFKDVELRYINIKKHAFALVKAIQKFRHYILRSKVITIVPNTSVKTLLIQNEIGERRDKLITSIQEFDIKIVPMKLVRGKALV